jgi:gliding motility-associated-like protein
MKIIFYILLFLISLPTFATHNRAGEITFKHVSGFTYEVTVVTYVKESSPAERPNLEIFWGDGTSLDSIPRIESISLGNDIEKNIYKDRHTYPGASPLPYTIRIEDPNRNAGVINVPNSVNIVFYLETKIYINPFLGVNNSPELLNPPIDNACVGKVYVHNPGAYDVDGDSLYYSLQSSLQTGGQPIPGYVFPQASSSLSVNPVTGDLIWDSPTQLGEYNVAILIEEFRGGIKIGAILRDLQITVAACSNNPPIITGTQDTCIVVGDTLNMNFNAFDPDGNNVVFSATGGPLFSGVNAASFNTTAISSDVDGSLYWIPQCSEIQKGKYLVSFKATDDGDPNLVDFHSLFVKVIAPEPKNLSSTVLTNAISIKWDKTGCNQALKYKIYRKQGPSGWVPSYCETGIPAFTGFQLIGETNSNNDTIYVDSNSGLGLISGANYCYRVIAVYPDGSESRASDEVCDQLRKDVPIITNVSINSTSTTSGQTYVAWSKPTEHDTAIFKGPYRYLVYRGASSTALTLIDSTATINDTTYIDNNLNTKDNQYFYRVDIYNLTGGTRDLIGKSTVASSVYLNLIPSDNQITLEWNENVPWTNTQHVIYKYNFSTLAFDSINITTNSNYVDTGLVNGSNYCYQVKSFGGYSSSGLIYPILNFSQENCAEPVDNVLPCEPRLSIKADCELQENILSWDSYYENCDDDVLSVNIYKKDSIDGEFYLVTTINNGVDSVFIHDNITSIAGCYILESIDSVGNRSIITDTVCVENCPKYELPNVFTPGSDGRNDFFKPFPFQYVKSVDIKIYNRWGNLVFETTNPEILWDGKNQKNSQPCSDGTYFYVCTVNEIYLDGTRPKVLKGFIHLLSNKGSGNNFN